MADVGTLRWQNRTIRADNAFTGIFGLGLLLAWSVFVDLFLHSPGIAETVGGLPPLLRSVLDKGYYAPDLGMILLGFIAFHKQRDLRLKWDWGQAIASYRRMVVPLAAYLVLSLGLFELASFASGRGSANPWTSPLFGPLFQMIVVMAVGVILILPILSWAWETLIDQVLAVLCMVLSYFGASFYFGVHQVGLLWAAHLPVSFMLGLVSCSMLFRAVMYLEAVRGSMVLLGWFTLIGGSILAGPFFFFLGFVMIAAGAALNERMTPLPGERGFLAWARTALGVALAAPAVLLAWQGMAPHLGLPLWLAVMVMAVVTQLLGLVLYAVAQVGIGALSRGGAQPAKP